MASKKAKKLLTNKEIQGMLCSVAHKGCDCGDSKCTGPYRGEKLQITKEQRERISCEPMIHIKCLSELKKILMKNRITKNLIKIDEVIKCEVDKKGALRYLEVHSCNSVEPFPNLFKCMDMITDHLGLTIPVDEDANNEIEDNKTPKKIEFNTHYVRDVVGAYWYVNKEGKIDEYYEVIWWNHYVSIIGYHQYKYIQEDIYDEMTKVYGNEIERRKMDKKKDKLKTDKSLSPASLSSSQVVGRPPCSRSKGLKGKSQVKRQSKGGKSKANHVAAVPWNSINDDSTELEDNMDFDDINENDDNELEVDAEHVNEEHAEVENVIPIEGMNVVDANINTPVQNSNVRVEINPSPGINRKVSISTEVVQPSAPQSTFRFVNVDQTNSANKMEKQHDFNMQAKVTNVQLSSDNNQDTPKMMNNFSKTNILIVHDLKKELGPDLFQVSQSIFSTESEEQSNENQQQFNQSQPENYLPINESNFQPTNNSEFKFLYKKFDKNVAKNSPSLPVFLTLRSNLSKDVHSDLLCPKSISSNGSHSQTEVQERPSKEDQQLLSESLAKMKQAQDVYNSAQSGLIEYQMRIKKRTLDEATSYPIPFKPFYDNLNSKIKSEFSSSPNTSFDTYVKSEFVPPGDGSHYQDTNVTGGNLASQSTPSVGVTQPFMQMDQVNYQVQQKANGSYKLATNLANNRQLNGNNHSNSKTSSETPSYHGNRVTNSINQTEISSSLKTSFDVFDKSKFVTLRNRSHYQNSDITRENFASPLTTSMGVSQPFKQMDQVNYQVQQKANGSYKLATNLANNHQLNCNNPSILANSKTSSENQSYHGNGVLNSTNQTEFSSSLNTSFDIFGKSKFVPPRDGPICQDSNHHGGSIASRMDTTKFVSQPFEPMDQVNYQTQLAANLANNHQINGNNHSNLVNSQASLANQSYHGNRVSNSTNQIDLSSYPNNLNSANNNKDNHMNPGFNWRPEATSSACASHSNHNNNRNINPMEDILPTNMHAGLINVKTINQYMNVTMNNITINNANVNNAIMNNVTMNTSPQQIGPSSFSPNSSMYYPTEEEQQQTQSQMNNNLAPFVNEPQQNLDHLNATQNEWQNESVHSHTDTGITHYSNCCYDSSSSFYPLASHSESYSVESTPSSTFMDPQNPNRYVQNSHAVTNDGQVPSSSYNSQSIDNLQQSNPNSDSQGYNALVALNRQFGSDAPINPFDSSNANYNNNNNNNQNQLSFVRQLGTNDHPLSIAQQNVWQDQFYAPYQQHKRQMVKQERNSSTIIPKQEFQNQTVPGQKNMFQNAAQQSYHGNQHYSFDGYNPDAYGNSSGSTSGNSSGISQQQPYSQAFNEAYMGQMNQ